MFFDDAAAGAQRKGRRLVHAFGAEAARGTRVAATKDRQDRKRKINQNEAALAVRANEQGGVLVALEMGDDLSGKVHADVENLIGVGEHETEAKERVSKADGTGFRFQLGSKQAHGGLQHGVDVDGGKPGGSLTGKSEQARNQRGRARTCCRLARPGVVLGGKLDALAGRSSPPASR